MNRAFWIALAFALIVALALAVACATKTKTNTVYVDDGSPDEDDDASPDDDDDNDDDSTPVYQDTWIDPHTGLTWENGANIGAQRLTKLQAELYCGTLSLEGGSWRLPTIDELRTIVRGCPNTYTGGACGVTDQCPNVSCFDMAVCGGCPGTGPAYNGAFWPKTLRGPIYPHGDYWAITADGNEDESWTVDFMDAEVYYWANATGIQVRCVR